MDSAKQPLLGNAAIEAAVKKGNINIAGTMQMEVMDLNEESKEAQLVHAESLRKFETKKRARSIIVPTSIEDIKTKLRELREPVTLFGEGPADCRERLREVIAKLDLSDEEVKKLQDVVNQSSTTGNSSTSQPSSSLSVSDLSKNVQKEVFYSPATDAMIQMRKFIAEYSFTRGHNRIFHTKQVREDDEKQLQENSLASNLYKNYRNVILNSSQYGDDRPLTCIRYSPHQDFVATGSLTTVVKLWDMKCDMAHTHTIKGYEDRVTSVAWHPQAFLNSNSGILATTSAGSTCNIWKYCYDRHSNDTDTEPNARVESSGSTLNSSILLHKLEGHQGGLTSCDFHPSGRVFGTTSCDYTWRLWDVETAEELLLQDGHIKECSAISFHPDGSLVTTADYAGVVLVWDLRSGQQVQSLQGHVKKITSVCMSANGFQVVSGGTDNTVRVWDLRKRKCAYVVPAHLNVVSDLKLSSSGELMLTSSFDGTVKVWGTRDYRCLQTLQGHVGKVMSTDFASDERRIVSAGFDRTIKYWTHRDEY